MSQALFDTICTSKTLAEEMSLNKQKPMVIQAMARGSQLGVESIRECLNPLQAKRESTSCNPVFPTPDLEASSRTLL